MTSVTVIYTKKNTKIEFRTKLHLKTNFLMFNRLDSVSQILTLQPF